MRYGSLLSGLMLILVFTGCELDIGEPRATRTPTPLPFPLIEAEGMLYSDADVPELFIALDQEVYEEVFEALRIGDTLGAAVMVTEGKVFLVQNGVKILVLDSSSPFGQTKRWRVRVLEDSAIGQAGWVPEYWLAPISNQAVPTNTYTPSLP